MRTVPLGHLPPLNELDEHPEVAAGVNERNRMPAPTAARRLVYELHSIRLELRHGHLQIVNLVRDVMEALAAARDEFTDGAVGTRRSDELKEGLSKRKHRLFDSLFVYAFPVNDLEPPHRLIEANRIVEIGHRERDVFDLLQHGRQS